MSFGENLQYLRKQNKITQEELADFLQVSRQSVSKWETGEAYPETEKLIALSDKFAVTLDALLRGDVTEPNVNERNPDECATCTRNCEFSATQVQNYGICREAGYRATGNGAIRTFSFKEGMSAKILDYVGFASGILCALACIIFVFFTGMSMNASLSSAQYENLFLNGDDIDLFYFFGKAYKDLNTLNAHEDFQSIYKFGSVAPIILGTVVSAIAIAGTATFFILALVSAYNKLAHKGGEKFLLFTAVTFAFYIFGVVAISSICRISTDIYYNNYYYETNADVHATFSLNGATVAGVVLSVIGLAFQTACKLLKDFKSPQGAKEIVSQVIAFACLIFAVAIISVSANAGIGMSAESSTILIGKTYNSMPFWCNGIMLIESIQPMTENLPSDLYLNIDLAVIFGFVAQVAVLLVAVCTITSFALSLGGRGKSAVRILSFVSLGIAIIMVTFGALSADKAHSATEVYRMFGSAKINYSYGCAIAVTVLSAICAVINVIAITIDKIEEKSE